MAALETIVLPVLSDNYVYLLRDSGTGTVAVVDPGEAAPVEAALEERGWTLDLILNTHHHADHTGGNGALKRRYGARIAGPKADAHRIEGLDVPLAEGDRIAVGDHEARVIETPGHTSGHISLWFGEAGALFCADTLFALGCGRLFEGTPEEMWESLRRLRALPDGTTVYCGHEYTQANARFALSVDPDNPDLKTRAAEIDRLRAAGRPTVPSKLGVEKKTNPFLRADDPGLARSLGHEGDPVAAFAELRSRKDSFRP